MKEAEFSEILGRLLTDGRLRDLFAADPDGAIASLCDDEAVRAGAAALKIDDLEFQARVLLKKRFEAVRARVPELVGRLGGEAWPWFAAYGRYRWLRAGEDALGFAEYAWKREPGSIDRREWNRLRFMVEPGRALEFHPIRMGRFCAGLQILLRVGKRGWREFVLSLRF